MYKIKIMKNKMIFAEFIGESNDIDSYISITTKYIEITNNTDKYLIPKDIYDECTISIILKNDDIGNKLSF